VAPEVDDKTLVESNATTAFPLNRVTYHDIWDDVTVVYEASPGAIVESTYYVNATEQGVPFESIRLGYNRPVSLDEQGNLLIAYENGIIMESAPVAWQEIDGQRKPVTAAFTLKGEREVGFYLDDYVSGIPVVIDPVLTWNTFLGNTGVDSQSTSIAVDDSGNVYVTGSSNATWGDPVQGYAGGNWDAFAAKLDSVGALTWNTFLGSAGADNGFSIAVDGSGNVYVSGYSDAGWGDPERAYTVGNDGFAAKLDSAGTLTWNTFQGGTGYDKSYSIAVDDSGNVYIGGLSDTAWGDPVRGYGGGLWDAFAVKLDSAGALTWNTFLGGTGSDQGYGVAVDGSGNVYAAGWSNAAWGDPERDYTQANDAFAAKLDSAGALTWNTFLGGTGGDVGYDIAADGSGNVYITGWSDATWGDPERDYTQGNDGFAAKLSSTGALTWNTFLGGTGSDYGYDIAVDGSGNVYVGGYSNATWGSPWRDYTLGNDAFAVKLDSSGALTWNTFLGGDGGDLGYGIAVDGSDNVYVAGWSNASWGDPVRDYAGDRNAFAAKISKNPPTVTNVNPNSGNQGQTLNNVIITGTNFIGTTAVDFGAGITVNSYIVNSDTQITANITIAANAAIGTRNVTVTTPEGTGALNNGFTVNLAPAPAPAPATAPVQPETSSAPTIYTPNPPRILIPVVRVEPQQAAVNQHVDIYANVVNRGDIQGTYTAELKINDEIVQTKSGDIGGNMGTPLKFTVYKDQPGTYEVDINGTKAYFTIVDEANTSNFLMNIPLICFILCALGVITVSILLVLRRQGFHH
jgi:hypothetical protein